MKKVTALTLAALVPGVALAQNLTGLINTFSNILAMLVPIFITLAVLFFFYGIIKYLAGGAEDKEQAKNIMIWGVVALFVMVSVFGLIRLIGNTLGVGQGGGISVPQVPVR